jgi:hypothetical protein
VGTRLMLYEILPPLHADFRPSLSITLAGPCRMTALSMSRMIDQAMHCARR